MICASQIKWFCRQLHRNHGASNLYHEADVETILQLIERIVPMGEDNRRTFWIKAEKGTIEDFVRYDQYLQEASLETNLEVCEQMFEERYPNRIVWFSITSTYTERQGYCLTIDNDMIYDAHQTCDDGTISADDMRMFCTWLIAAIESAVNAAEKGTYGDDVEKNLPLNQRYGIIQSRFYWKAFPKRWDKFMEGLSEKERIDFLTYSARQSLFNPQPIGMTIASMNLNDYYAYCTLLYKVCDIDMKYYGLNQNSDHRAWYSALSRKNNDELLNIDPDDSEAFKAFISAQYGNRYTDLIIGGSVETEIRLTTHYDEHGYWFELGADGFGRTKDVVKMYNVMVRNNIAVLLYDAAVIRRRLLQTDLIGIVPENEWPSFCHTEFFNYHIADYMHLPQEKREALLPHIQWRMEEPLIIKR